MESLTKDDFETLSQCPWDDAPSDGAEFLYQDDMGCDVVKCPSCGIVYAKRRLNENGLSKYWSDYLSRVHVHDPETVEKRNQMYQIDYAFSSQFVRSGKVLDVGCGNGSFMKVYEQHGYDVTGVEYGEEAADTAKKGIEFDMVFLMKWILEKRNLISLFSVVFYNMSHTLKNI